MPQKKCRRRGVVKTPKVAKKTKKKTKIKKKFKKKQNKTRRIRSAMEKN